MSKKQVTIIEAEDDVNPNKSMKFTRGGRSTSLMGT